MAKETIKVLIEGGKATAAPPLGPALGPMGVNIGQIVTDINKKTSSFKGMQVPVTVTVDKDSKEFEIAIGTPPASGLIKKEAGIEKGSGNPLQDKIANLRIENIIKIAKMKESSLLGKTLKEKVKEVIGTCNSMGVMVGGVSGKEAMVHVEEGKYDKEIKEEKTELSAAELKEIEAERKKLEEDIKKRKAEYEAKAKEIIGAMAGKERGEIKAKMVEEGIPDAIIKELLPAEGVAAPGAAPAEGEAPAEAAEGEAPAAEGKEEAPKEEAKEEKEEKKGKK